MKSIVALSVVVFLAVIAVDPASSLRCYQCGEYVDDVGSITPCTVELTEKHLQMCSPNVGESCVKYVSPGIEAYGCSGSCQDKRATEGSVFCCQKDGCNSSGNVSPSVMALFAVTATSLLLALRRQL